MNQDPHYKVQPREWKLWLDDLRNPLRTEPYGSYWDFVWARDCEQAKYYTRMWGMPAFMALDHDLGVPVSAYASGCEISPSQDSEDVFLYLQWLANRYHDCPPPEYRVHSANPMGQQRIISFMESWKKAASLPSAPHPDDKPIDPEAIKAALERSADGANELNRSLRPTKPTKQLILHGAISFVTFCQITRDEVIGRKESVASSAYDINCPTCLKFMEDH